MTQSILVTGGAGHIGGEMALKLARLPDTTVTIVDNLVTSTRDRVPTGNGAIRFVKADVNRWPAISTIMLAQRFDYVFHYAALVGVQRTLAQPIDVLRDIDGISNILELAKNTGVKRVFYASSSEVYGEPVEFPQNEHTTPLNSRLPYAIVKNVGEAFLRSYQQEYGLPYTVFRFFNTYGPRQSLDFVISKFLRAALRGEPLTIYGDGQQTRTFCYVDDNVECAIRCLTEGHSINDVVNIGSALEMTVLDLAQQIIALTGSASRIEHLPALKEGDMTRRLPDNRRMIAILGRELTTLDEGLRIVLPFFDERVAAGS